MEIMVHGFCPESNHNPESFTKLIISIIVCVGFELAIIRLQHHYFAEVDKGSFYLP